MNKLIEVLEIAQEAGQDLVKRDSSAIHMSPIELVEHLLRMKDDVATTAACALLSRYLKQRKGESWVSDSFVGGAAFAIGIVVGVLYMKGVI